MEFVESVGVSRGAPRLYGFYLALRLRSATEMLSDRKRIALREIGQITTNPTEYYLKDLIPIMGIEEIFMGVS